MVWCCEHKSPQHQEEDLPGLQLRSRCLIPDSKTL